MASVADIHARWRRRLRSGIALVVSLHLFGCGGSLNLTGGSVPIGTSRLAGVVVHAENVTQVVPGVQMTLTRGAQMARRTADAAGQFDFGAVTDGFYTCTAQTPEAGFGKGWAWPFSLSPHTPAHLVAALWPDWFAPSTIGHVELAPSALTLHVGDRARFVATAYDSQGRAIPLSLSLLLQGNVGEIGPDGSFRAVAPGHARLTTWLPEHVAQAEITVIP